MKKTQTLILLTSLAVSSVAFAATGAAPRCTSGALNLVVVNKDVGGCPGAAAGHYCLYDLDIGSDPWRGFSCEDSDNDVIYEKTNESYSFSKNPNSAEIIHDLGSDTNGKIKIQRLRFAYDHGVASDNCAAVFGPDIKCAITESGNSKHRTYTLTIGKDS